MSRFWIVILVVTGITGASAVEAQPRFIYWTDSQQHTIYRGQADGSSYKALLTERNPGLFTTRDSLLFWVDQLSNTINRTIMGRSQTDILAAVENVRGLEVTNSGETLYWSTVDDSLTHVHRLILSDDTRDTVLSVAQRGMGFDVDSQAEEIYWIQDGSIRRARTTNGEPEVLLEDLNSPTRLTLDVDNGHMYWISAETIYRANLDGSHVDAQGSGAPARAILDVADQTYYWTQGDSLIKRASIDGSGEEIVAEKPLSPHTNLDPHAIKQLHLDAKSDVLYWRGAGVILPANIWRKHLTQNTIETALIGFVAPAGLTVDPSRNHLYWTAGQGKVLRSNLDGTDVREITQVACGIGHLTDIVFDGVRDRLYWGHETDCPSYDIYRSDLTGEDVEIVQAFNQPWGLALDAQKGELYWTEHAPYVLERAHIDTLFETKEHKDVATDLHPWGVAINAETSYIYWTDPYANTIERSELSGEHREEALSALSEPRDLSLDVTGNTMYWIEQGPGSIRRAGLDGSGVETLFTGLHAPEYLALTFATARILSTEASEDVPAEYRLFENYPNPFNPQTSIRFAVPEATRVSLVVYNAQGRTVAHVLNQRLPPGTHIARFNSSGLPSGVYFYHMQAGSFSKTKSMVLVK